jgi:hypothetical protein
MQVAANYLWSLLTRRDAKTQALKFCALTNTESERVNYMLTMKINMKEKNSENSENKTKKTNLKRYLLK